MCTHQPLLHGMTKGLFILMNAYINGRQFKTLTVGVSGPPGAKSQWIHAVIFLTSDRSFSDRVHDDVTVIIHDVDNLRLIP